MEFALCVARPRSCRRTRPTGTSISCANPARVVAFNIVEGWVRDVTVDIAAELRDRCGERGEVPESLQDFLEHRGH